MKLTAIFLILAQAAGAAETISLGQAVERGLKADNIVKQEAARLDGARAGLRQARLAKYGGLKLKGMLTHGDDPVYAFATAMKQGTFSMASMATINDPEPARNYMGGIEAGVPLYTGGALKSAAAMGALGVEAAASGHQRAQAGITFKITYQWLTALLRARLAGTADAAVAAAEEEMKTANNLMKQGMVPGADYFGAEAILSTLKGYQLGWRKALELEEARLGVAAGAEGPLAAGGELLAPGYGAGPAGVAGRRDVKALEKMADISQEAEAVAGNSILPVVEAFGAWETNSKSLSDFRDNSMLGLRVTVPLGEPGYYAKRDAARAATAMARGRADEARRQAALELTEAENNYAAALESLPVARETMEKAKKSLELFRPLYRQGRQSVLEVLRAQAAVMQAEAGYYEALYKVNLFHAQRLLAAEALDAAAVKEISEKLGKGK